MEVVKGPVGLRQVTEWFAGSVIVQLTPPVGCKAPDTPVTFVVSVVVPPRTGLLEAVTPITGSCLARVRVIEELEEFL